MLRCTHTLLKRKAWTPVRALAQYLWGLIEPEALSIDHSEAARSAESRAERGARKGAGPCIGGRRPRYLPARTKD